MPLLTQCHDNWRIVRIKGSQGLHVKPKRYNTAEIMLIYSFVAFPLAFATACHVQGLTSTSVVRAFRRLFSMLAFSFWAQCPFKFGRSAWFACWQSSCSLLGRWIFVPVGFPGASSTLVWRVETALKFPRLKACDREVQAGYQNVISGWSISDLAPLKKEKSHADW